ncbi:hypothetical protein B0H17DRAFT_1142750 [Mycena rosella]|uniref:Uncharacterized protein n=1 Tax=Mycena rosella TaxID=1033263 RepID=A0AAD7CWI2_MYCRO|nr:hypothetical protein B0H17DRAFT_1142750 [Mycena rosella]
MHEWAASAFRHEEQAGGHMFRINAVLTLGASRLCPTAALDTDVRGQGICAWTWAWRVGAIGHWRRAGFNLEVTKRAACMGAREMHSWMRKIQVLAVVAPPKFVHLPYANGCTVDVDGVIDIHSDGTGLASVFEGMPASMSLSASSAPTRLPLSTAVLKLKPKRLAAPPQSPEAPAVTSRYAVSYPSSSGGELHLLHTQRVHPAAGPQATAGHHTPRFSRMYVWTLVVLPATSEPEPKARTRVR